MPKAGQKFENKEEYIKRVFASVAPVYDLMNSVMTMGMVRGWYRFLITKSEIRPGDKILDVGAGTGEITLLSAKKSGPLGMVVGLDLSREMLNIAREKFKKADKKNLPAPVFFIQGNALKLPFCDQYFDIVTTGFTLRNVTDIPGAIREMSRVCKTGGKVICLEISHPPGIPGWGFHLYFHGLIPILGRLAGKSKKIPGGYPPYTWLSHSLAEFPQGKRMEGIFSECGLKDIKSYPLSGGIVTVYKGRK